MMMFTEEEVMFFFFSDLDSNNVWQGAHPSKEGANASLIHNQMHRWRSLVLIAVEGGKKWAEVA